VVKGGEHGIADCGFGIADCEEGEG
jgi:hypothetical protein